MVNEPKSCPLCSSRSRPRESRNWRTIDCDMWVPSERMRSLVRSPEYGRPVIAVTERLSRVTLIVVGPVGRDADVIRTWADANAAVNRIRIKRIALYSSPILRRTASLTCLLPRDMLPGDRTGAITPMSFRRIVLIRVALAAVLTLSAALTASAQGRGGSPEPYTPAKDAKDLKAVLFNWMRYMDMLKGHDERDMVATLEYQGKGTIQVDGQPCTLTKYRASTNYQTFSQRIQYTCTRPNGQAYSNIEVVSGLYAWDEDTPGAEIGPTKGKVTPMPATVQERLIRLWASPQGAAKAAVRRDNRDVLAGNESRDSFRRRRHESGPDLRLVGERQAGGDVPDSRRTGSDREPPRWMRST